MKKIIFADQLRALAALAVIFIHLGGGYWAWRADIAARIMAPVLAGPNSRMLYAVDTFNFGPFGVSLFFLISGFVIPFSLETMTGPRFLIARAFRIYPTYIACLCVSLGAAWLSSRHWGQPFVIDRQAILLNALLINNLHSIPSFDLVNWTLAIEVKFYIVMAGLALLSAHRHVVSFVIVALVIAVATWRIPHTDVETTLLLRDLAFVPYMLIGTVLNLHLRGKVSNRGAVVSMLALAAIFHFIVLLSVLDQQPLPAVMDVYLLNIAVFSLAYVFRDAFRPNRVIDFLARISYPLYAVHPIVGYACLRFMMANGVPPELALVATVAIVIGTAYVVHRVIELPSTRFGRRVAMPAAPTLPATHEPG